MKHGREDIFGGPNFFQKNEEIYNKFLNESVHHSLGFFILAPSGTGKTHFIVRQEEKNWIDGDTLWISTKAHPDTDWWTKGPEIIKEVDARSDVITQEAKRLGLWVLGASNNWLRPDAVVLPPWDTNVAYIKHRQENNYDGGLKTDQLAQLEAHRLEIEDMAKQKNVPIFESVEKATSYIEELYKQSNI
ncbi:MAG: hypothetical protein NTZ36_00300 [Candidatus Jorgensenbacteria bacterium]|nr:hypothetical protein [Candidatus Jorgensenbacteria bacterium]